MTMNELAILWADYIESLVDMPTAENVIEFCNTYATSYEEYNAMYELLADRMGE